MRALLAAIAAFPLMSATFPVTATSGVEPWRHPEVVQIMCDKVAGTAFRVSPQVYLSVAHVTHNSGCEINGQPFKEVHQEGDFAVLSSDTPDQRWLKVDCEGFRRDHRYVAIGYAQGLPTLTEVDLDALGQRDSQLSLLRAVFTVIPGMSGGPIVDGETGEVVGTVNTYNSEDGVSGSVELKRTSVCRDV
jgi:hypothetical protein